MSLKGVISQFSHHLLEFPVSSPSGLPKSYILSHLFDGYQEQKDEANLAKSLQSASQLYFALLVCRLFMSSSWC